MIQDNSKSFNFLIIEQLVQKYNLKPSQVKDMYLFTLDDYEMLDKACKYLAKGETRADVVRRIVLDLI